MARATSCAGSAGGAGGQFGKLFDSEDRQQQQILSEFGAPLFLSDGQPATEQPALIETPPDGSKTLWELLNNSVSRNRGRNAVGHRKLVRAHNVEENGKQVEKLELENTYTWLTYGDYLNRITNFASGLVHWTGVQQHGRIVIYAETQQDWMVSAFAAFSLTCEVVTIYATLGADGAKFGLLQTEAAICVADAKLVQVLAKIAGECEELKYIVTLGNCDVKAIEKLTAADKTVKTFDDVVKLGESNKVDARPPQPNDLAVIMYTSGTTGAPKGVKLSHKNITAAVAGFKHAGEGFGISEETRFLSYLPLAHIMEMVAEVSILCIGAAMGYGSPQTLTETGLKLKKPETQADALILKPTFMVFAPAIFDRVYKGVLGKVSAKGKMAKWMFETALDRGMRNFNDGGIGVNPVLNKIVFGAVQGSLGGCLSLAITGSAPLSPEIQRFMQTVFKCPVRQGYGLTENCACASVGIKGDNAVKSVGPPVKCTTIRLADWPEGQYENKDKFNPEIGMPRGEVLVGGPTVCEGYFVSNVDPDPEITKKNEEDFVYIGNPPMRYFRTGDIGQITQEGTLQIIDRKKDLWKGPQGEYVSLGKVESCVKLSPYIDIPMVYGKTGGEFPILLVCPNDRELMKFAGERNLPTDGVSMYNHADINAEIMRSVKEKAKEVGLIAFEIPQKLVVIPNIDGQPAWTPENDLLTAAMKLKRPIIVRAHQREIDECYAS